MKKLLSIILAVSVIMSVFCVVPVSAAFSFGTYALPYVYEDFTTEHSFFSPNETTKFTQTWDQTEGHNTLGSLKFEQIHTGSSYTNLWTSGSKIGAGVPIHKGDQVEIKFWIKLAQEMNPTYAKTTAIVWFKDPDTGAANKRKNVSFVLDDDNLDWQQVSITVDFSQGWTWTATSTTIQEISFSSGDLSNGMHVKNQDKNSSPRTNPVFWLDEYELTFYTPVASNLTMITDAYALGEAKKGTKVSVGYTWNEAAGTDASIYRLLADGVCVGVFKKGTDIIVPAIAEGKTLSVEIIPYTSTNVKDDKIKVSVNPEFIIEHKLGTATATSYTSTAKITNNNPNGTAINAVLVLVCFAADGSVVDWAQAAVKSPATVGNSGDDPITVTVTAPQEGFKAPVDHCISYLLDCGDEPSPTIFNTTLTEITPERDSRTQ